MESILLFIALICVGWFFGRLSEKRHYRSIEQRERKLMNLPTTSCRDIVVSSSRSVKEIRMVRGSVVVSVDYFKRVLAMLRMFFGGRVSSYETLVDRARREAILRMKESCLYADQFVNLRLETSSIYKGRGKQVGSVEVIAYATAVIFDDTV